MNLNRIWSGLFRRRHCLLPTLRGWLVLLVAAAALMIVTVRYLHPFLAVNDPVYDGALVVEGWAPDYALEAANVEFGRHHYGKLYVTGGPLERGAPLSEYKTFAELGAAALIRMGMNKDAIQAVPAPLVRQDRTYVSAVTLRNWLRDHDVVTTNINIISVGPHSRRSRLLFEKVFGANARVGIVAVEDRDYDPKHWWKSSQGVRSVIDETIAYGYARLCFFPSEEH